MPHSRSRSITPNRSPISCAPKWSAATMMSARAMDLRDTLEIKLSYFDQREDYQSPHRERPPHLPPFRECRRRHLPRRIRQLDVLDFQRRIQDNVHLGPLDHASQASRARLFLPHPGRKFELPPGIRAESFGKLDAIVGQHGFIYLDRETNQILRIVAAADPPAKFPVQQSTTVLDYDFRTVGRASSCFRSAPRSA